jgi:D-alanyl-D-alanine carboxypeptidase/D-alanyl-D-alanine-endopeptidase (penicillin-binding protein 4)
MTVRARSWRSRSALCWLWLAGLGQAAAQSPRAQDPASLVRQAEAAGLRTAVCVRDVDSGATVFAHRADRAQLPASNQKLLTGYGFLAAFGADHRFRTGFRVERGVLKVRAGGDPNWLCRGPVDPGPTFERIAAQLRSAGIRGLRGIEIEGGPFRGPGRGPDWPSGQEHRDYCAPTAGCALEQGCWLAEVGPGEEVATVRLLGPPGALALDGRIAMTSDRRRGGIFHLEVRGSSLAMRGAFLRGAPAREVRGAVDDPEALFRASLRAALAAAGIGLEAGAADLDLELEDVTSPLRPALRRMMVDSSNFDAEMLLRGLGAARGGDGSYAGGAAALAGILAERLGPLDPGIAIRDGSGLSRGNRATAGFLADLLVAAARSAEAELFLGALPEAGQEGTLARRFRDSALAGRVRAKTGTLSGASALSGYLWTRGDQLLAFSILMEWDRPVRGADPRDLQERLVAALDAGRG